MAVHVVGNVCLDTTFRLARFPRAGETLNADGCTVRLGGKGANQALAAARTGAETTLWAAIGVDGEGASVRRRLAESGLSDRGLVVVDEPTDRSSLLVERGGENMIVSAVGAARAFQPTGAGWLEAAQPGDIVLMQGNLPPDATAACLRRARERGLATILNASPLDGEGHLSLPPVDLVVVNRGEAEILAGPGDAAGMASVLLALGARQAVVTLGPFGAIRASLGDAAPVAHRAPAVDALDTSGAGDVLCGTLAGLLDAGFALSPALDLAIEAAAIAVTRHGAFGCGPSRAEFITLLSRMSA